MFLCPSIPGHPAAGDTPRPKGWGGVCNLGSHQSPIDIPLRSAASLSRSAACPSTGAIVLDYGPIKGSVINTGHALEVRSPGMCTVF